MAPGRGLGELNADGETREVWGERVIHSQAAALSQTRGGKRGTAEKKGLPTESNRDQVINGRKDYGTRKTRRKAAAEEEGSRMGGSRKHFEPFYGGHY